MILRWRDILFIHPRLIEIFIFHNNIHQHASEQFNPDGGEINQRIFIKVIPHFILYIVSGELNLLRADYILVCWSNLRILFYCGSNIPVLRWCYECCHPFVNLSLCNRSGPVWPVLIWWFFPVLVLQLAADTVDWSDEWTGV